MHVRTSNKVGSEYLPCVNSICGFPEENVDFSENWEVVRFAPMMDALFLLLLVLAEVCRITCPAYSLVLCICMVYTVRFGKDVEFFGDGHHSVKRDL